MLVLKKQGAVVCAVMTWLPSVRGEVVRRLAADVEGSDCEHECSSNSLRFIESHGRKGPECFARV